MGSYCESDSGKYSCNPYSGQTNKRAVKKKHSTHRRYIVHRFWLVHGRFICTHIQQVILPRNTETGSYCTFNHVTPTNGAG